MTLQQLYEQTPPQQRALQFGIVGNDALTGAFPQKRVVHAGLQGSLVSPRESQQIWQDLMAQAPTGKEVQTAYIHIPFCKTKCLYCGFFQNGMDQSVEDEYIRCLVQELRQAAKARRLRDSLIHAVFIGGGTPTSLSADNAARLLGAVRDCLPLANDYELTLEGRVHDLEPEKIDTWLAYGVNRISLGVQSLIRKSAGLWAASMTGIRSSNDWQPSRPMASASSSLTSCTACPDRPWTSGWRMSGLLPSQASTAPTSISSMSLKAVP